jgi:site-specific DNA-cytosine methylase
MLKTKVADETGCQELLLGIISRKLDTYGIQSKVLSRLDFNVPQNRRRLIILFENWANHQLTPPVPSGGNVN